MNYYSILKTVSKIKSQRIKLMGVYAFHLMGKRYMSMFIDPVLTCNLRCRMCYFSDKEKLKSLSTASRYTTEDLDLIANALFNRLLKLQIGCGAEPQTYPHLEHLVQLGKKYNVPYISLTTNGNLLTYERLHGLVANGLDEITISLHGITKETYEHFMVNASFDRFKTLLDSITKVKKEFPLFKVRINYTMNKDNTAELSKFWTLFDEIPINILQLRLFQQIGDSDYKEFDLNPVKEMLNSIVMPLAQQCRDRGILCLTPDEKNFAIVEDEDPDQRTIAEDLAYCSVSPQSCWKGDFNHKVDTYKSYTKRTKYGREILRYIISPSSYNRHKIVTHRSNYNVK